MSKTEESKLEKQVEKFMKSKKIWQLARFQAQSNQNGLPDRLYLYRGVLLGLELKTDKGSPTDLQLKKLQAINDNGGIGIIVTRVKTIDTLLSLLDRHFEPLEVASDATKKICELLKEMGDIDESNE